MRPMKSDVLRARRHHTTKTTKSEPLLGRCAALSYMTMLRLLFCSKLMSWVSFLGSRSSPCCISTARQRQTWYTAHTISRPPLRVRTIRHPAISVCFLKMGRYQMQYMLLLFTANVAAEPPISGMFFLQACSLLSSQIRFPSSSW